MKQPTLQLTYEGEASSLFTFIILALSEFLVFFSFVHTSMGMEFLFLSIVLLMLNPSKKNIRLMLPFVVVCITVLSMLVFSGRLEERGFNAPINHGIKSVYLMFTVALSIGIRNIKDMYKRVVIKLALISVLASSLASLFCVIFVSKYAIRYPSDYGNGIEVGFDQFYGVCILFCVLVYAVLSWKKVYRMRYYIVLLIVCSLLIVLSLFTTGLLLSVFGAAFGLFIYRYQQSKNRVAIWLIIGICFAFVFLFRNQISDLVYDQTESINWIVRGRIRSVADTIFGTDHNLDYSYRGRNELASYSINSFIISPIMGIGYNEYRYGTIGCHQEWQDLLGVFGIVGAGVFLSIMIALSISIFNSVKSRQDSISFCIALLLFVVLGFLNPCLSMPVLSAVFIIAPNVSVLFSSKD